MKEKIDKFIEYLPTITKEQSDFIKQVINWDSETSAAFLFAKRIFEEEVDENI